MSILFLVFLGIAGVFYHGRTGVCRGCFLVLHFFKGVLWWFRYIPARVCLDRGDWSCSNTHLHLTHTTLPLHYT